MARVGVERERKFLVRELPPGLSRYPRRRLEQGYLLLARSGVAGHEIRIRRDTDGAVLTIKRGRGVERLEVEVPLTPSAARKLWSLTKGRRISKDRYLVPSKSGRIEVDVYRGRFRGLVIAEVERTTMRQLMSFVPPSWLGREITGKKAYSNSEMARSGRRPRS